MTFGIVNDSFVFKTVIEVQLCDKNLIKFMCFIIYVNFIFLISVCAVLCPFVRLCIH